MFIVIGNGKEEIVKTLKDAIEKVFKKEGKFIIKEAANEIKVD